MMKRMHNDSLEKVYDPKDVEEKWMARWEKDAPFHAAAESERPAFSIVIPPPNVTGSLHLGHALNSTLQDILARWKRMSGFNVLWLPGMDHAGIATQNVVERQLSKDGADRHALGRTKFIEQVWHWKKEKGGTILKQLKRLGASCDWDRERFTLDEGLSRAVGEVFVRLYKEGLIHRDKRLINLCPHCRTALSDIEVEHEEIQGKMYHIQYPLADDPQTFLTVATTRPETMLGDTAVAVHPEDPRFNRLIGKKIKLPLTNRTIPIIGDPILVDREFGTGAVKITPGHDFNDEKSGKRHGLEKISLIDWSGKMNAEALQEAKVDEALALNLASNSMLEARKTVVRRLGDAKLLTKTEDHTMSLGKCYRCKTVVEPFDSPQWFVKVNEAGNSLAQPAIDAVRQKKVRLIPESWEANYFGWMENIEDWCISRQIWWGHQIPVWYCRDCDASHLLKVPGADEIIIASEATPIVDATVCPRCGGANLVQDPDVLDTWFSSALWPFSTLGWPAEKQPDGAKRKEAEALLKQFYPTSTLVSGFDILFFWVARMMMMGLHFLKDVPFKDVYIHALVRDAEGQKMSKSKGNVIDPLDLMDRYGTDALRFTLAAMASPGRDIKLAEERIEGYRNFCNKLWNAARFILMNLDEAEAPSDAAPSPSIAEGWIRGRLNNVAQTVNAALARYRFDEASAALYQFTWHEYCDWYLELVKVDVQEGNAAQKQAARQCLRETFETILRLLHPFMPFITEELRPYFSDEKEGLSSAAYPFWESKSAENWELKRAEDYSNLAIEKFIEIIEAIRNLRGEMDIPPSEKLTLLISHNPGIENCYKEYTPYIERLGRISDLKMGVDLNRPKMAATILTEDATLYIPLDEPKLKKEKTRLEKVLAKLEKEKEALQKRLDNESFRTKAPDAYRKVDAQMNEKHSFHKKVRTHYDRILDMLSETQ